MNQPKFNLAMAAATVVLFIAALALNELLFSRLEFIRGVNWIYLPAGVRLLCTLLFAEAGAIGLLIASWLACFFYFFPNDPVRSLAGGILASAAPYLVYLGARHVYGMHASLANMGTKGLLYCALAFSLASPLLHHAWFALYEERAGLWQSLAAMIVGDLGGTLIVLYGARLALRARPTH